MATIRIELKNAPNKSGECAIRIRLQDRGERKFIATDLKIHPDFWDKKKRKIKSTHPNAAIFNAALEKRVHALNADMKKQQVINETNNVDLNALAGDKVTKTPFHAYAAERFKVWQTWKSPATIDGLQSHFRILQRDYPALNIEDVNAEWLTKFEAKKRETCNSNGARKAVAYISAIIMDAMRDDIITSNPFKKYKRPSAVDGDRVWLTMEELQSLESLVAACPDDSGLRNVGSWFLLSCYSGLRFGDVEKFNPANHIKAGRLILRTSKKKVDVSIFITPKLQQIIDNAMKCGRVMSNESCNQHLKTFGEQLGLTKPLTFHSGRHTFAVGCASLGIGIETTAKLLGHTDIRVTAIYYKIMNPMIDSEMQKWNNFGTSAPAAPVINFVPKDQQSQQKAV